MLREALPFVLDGKSSSGTMAIFRQKESYPLYVHTNMHQNTDKKREEKKQNRKRKYKKKLRQRIYYVASLQK